MRAVVGDDSEVFAGVFIDSAGKEWITETLAGQRFGIPRLQLHRFRSNDTKALGGCQLSHQKLNVIEADSRGRRYPRERRVYLVEQIEKLLKVSAEHEGLVRISDCGFSNPAIREWQKDGRCRHVDGATLYVQALPTLVRVRAHKLRNGRFRKAFTSIKLIKYIRRSDLEQIAMALKPALMNRDRNWLSGQEGAETCGLNKGSIYIWSTKAGCSVLGGRPIDCRNVWRSDGRALRFMREYYRPDLELVAKRLKKRRRTIYEDAEGKWLSRSAVLERFPMISATDLRDLHRRGDWYHQKLPPEWRLSAKQVPVDKGAWRTKPIVWAYLESDIVKAIAARDGQPFADEQAPPPTAPATLTVGTIIADKIHAGHVETASKGTTTAAEHGKPPRPKGIDQHDVPSRNALFKDWYLDKKLITFRKPARIRDIWNEYFPEACIADGENGAQTVYKATR